MIEACLLMCTFCTLIAVGAAAYVGISGASINHRFANFLEAEARAFSQTVRQTSAELGPLREKIDATGAARAEKIDDDDILDDMDDEEEARKWLAK